MGLNKHNKWVIYEPTSLPRLITFNAFYFCLWPKTFTFERFGSKSPSNQLEALFLTIKKLIISPQSNPFFLSTITRELFLLTSLAACFFSCLLKLLFILALDTNSSDLYSATACKLSLLLSAIVISFCHFQIRCLPSWDSFLICDKFCAMPSKMASNSALSSNCFWFPLNFSCTTSLSSLLLCSICFPLPSIFFLKKILKHGKDLINGC